MSTPIIVVAVLLASLSIGLIGAGFVVRSRLRARPPSTSELTIALRGWLFEFARPYRGALGVGLGLTLLATLLGLAAPWPFKIMVDNALGGEPLPEALSAFGDLSQRGLALASVGAGLILVMVSVVISYLITYVIGAMNWTLAAGPRFATALAPRS